MVERFDSFPTDPSDHSDSDELPASSSHCKLCKVKLNIIGIYHTKKVLCSKCCSTICMGCLSRRNISKSSKLKLCKICSDKEILLSDSGEIDNIQEEVRSLKLSISSIKHTNLQTAQENERLKEKIRAQKKRMLNKEASEEIARLERDKIILEDDLNGIQHFLTDVNNGLHRKREELECLQTEQEKNSRQIQLRFEEFSSMKKLFSEVERMKKTDLVRNKRKSFPLSYKNTEKRIQLLLMLEKGFLASGLVSKLEHEVFSLKKLVLKAENLLKRFQKGGLGMSFIDKFNGISSCDSYVANKCACTII